MAKLMGTWARPGLLLARNRHGGTVTFREMHSLPVVTWPVRGHKPAEVSLDSNQFSFPAWSLLLPEHCFPGFSGPSFFPRYTVLGAAASREPQVPRMSEERAGSNFSRSPSSPGLMRGLREARSPPQQALCAPLPYTGPDLGTRR